MASTLKFCQHFGTCGGCTLQHLSYDDQLKLKQEQIQALFPNSTIGPIIAATNPWHYRNKLEFTFSFSQLGLFGKRGRVVTLSECLLAPPWFLECLQAVHSWWQQSGLTAYFPPKNRGSLRTLILRQSQNNQKRLCMLTVSGESEFSLSEEQIQAFKDTVHPFATSIVLHTQILKKKCPTIFQERILLGPPFLEEKLSAENNTLHFLIHPSSFFQPNPSQAQIIYSKALEISGLEKSMHVFDLYAGTGTLGLFAAHFVKKVTSIEIDPHAVFSAKENAALNNISNIEILQGDVGTLLCTLPKPDLILLDPPRAGLGKKAINHLLHLKAPKILYISCNPKTQADDIAQLTPYVIEKIVPIDQFPHTLHIENIVLLRYNFSDI